MCTSGAKNRRRRTATARIARVAAAAVIAAAGAGCGGGGDDEPASAAVAHKTFDDWSGFLSAGAGERAGARPVVVIGIDGAPWQFIDRLIDEGRLPNVARLVKEGARATLRSNRTYVTPPGWTAMFTGYLEGKSGIYSFGTWLRETQEFVATNSDDVRVPFVWEAASRAGLRTGVFNVPMTWPPYPVNGALVTGMMTPIDARSATAVARVSNAELTGDFATADGVVNYARPLRVALADSLNYYLITLHDTTDDRAPNYNRVSLRILSRSGGANGDAEVFVFDTGEYSGWLPILRRRGESVERAWCRVKLNVEPGGQFNLEFSQTVFPLDVPYTYPDTLAGVLAGEFGFYLPTKFLSKEVVPALAGDMGGYANFFYDYDDWDLFTFVFTQSDNIHHLVGFGPPAGRVYEAIDRAIGNIMGKMPPGGILIVASDHGNGQYEWGIDLNQVFTHLRLLRWESPGVIDHDGTLVFHNLWHLYFNREKITREELAARGIDVPAGEDPYEYLTGYVTAAGRGIRAGETGRVFPVNFHRVTDRTDGNDPDMWVEGGYEDYVCDYWNIKVPHKVAIRRLQGSDRNWHIRDGIVMVWGEGVRRGYDAGTTDIQNVAPTILYLLALPVSPDMDGALVADFFEPSLLEGHARYVTADYRNIPRETAVDTDEREALEKKLKSLGYIR